MGKYSADKDVNARRMLVAEMMHRRIPQHEIIKVLNERGVVCSQRTVSLDESVILKTWLADHKDTEALMRSREAKALDHLEMVAQANLENALKKRQAVEKRDQDNQKSVAWERYDRAVRAWFDERIKIQKRRAELFNLDLQQPSSITQVQQNVAAFIFEKRPDGMLDGGNGHQDQAVIEGEIVEHGG